MKNELALFRGWMAQRPTDRNLRFEQAAILSWLGTNAEKQGRFEESEAFFEDALRDLAHLRRVDRDNVRFREEWLDVQLLLVDVHSKAGHFAKARDSAEAANREADALVAHDAANRKWQAAQGIARYWRAQLASTGAPKEAVPMAREAEIVLAAVHDAEPKDARVKTWLDRTRRLQVQLAQPAVAAAR